MKKTKIPKLPLKTEEELKGSWAAFCSKCGWDGLATECDGGQPLADSGDYDDLYCPKCSYDGNPIEDSEEYLHENLEQIIQQLQDENKELKELLDKVDSEFCELSQLDCPEYVDPNEDLWREIKTRLTEPPKEEN